MGIEIFAHVDLIGYHMCFFDTPKLPCSRPAPCAERHGVSEPRAVRLRGPQRRHRRARPVPLVSARAGIGAVAAAVEPALAVVEPVPAAATCRAEGEGGIGGRDSGIETERSSYG